MSANSVIPIRHTANHAAMVQSTHNLQLCRAGDGLRPSYCLPFAVKTAPTGMLALKAVRTFVGAVVTASF